MAFNKLTDLNDILFEELERLNDDDLMEDQETAEKEIKRAKAISEIAGKVVDNANTMLASVRIVSEYGDYSDCKNVIKLIAAPPREESKG